MMLSRETIEGLKMAGIELVHCGLRNISDRANQ